jgi:type IX secretion system PorP/SprF family membrane protein
MKKLYILTIIAVCSLTVVKGQQLPLYSNYIFTPYIFNPAMSGYSGMTEVALIHKRQWTGVQGAPNTSALAINGDLSEQKFGWSVYAYNDQTDIVSRSAIYGSYAYHIRFSEKNSISLGLSAGYLNNAIDQSAINVQDQFDPLLYANLNQGGKFDINFGLNLRLGDFMIGASAPQLLASTVSYSDNFDSPIQYNLLRHYIVHTQYDLKFQNDRMVLSPFIVMRAADNVQPQVDAGLMFDYTEYFFVGAAFRSNYAVTGNIGVHVTENITLGYAYDFSTSEFAYTLGNSHEFMLRWRFGKSKKDKRLENEIKKIKDRQNRSADETEEIVNERLDEFKDEIRRENAKTMEEQKKEVMNEVMVLYDPNNPNSPANNNNNQNPNTNQQNNNNNNSNGGTTPVTNPNTNNQNNNNASNNNSSIKGYNNNEYASQVQPGSPGYYVTAGVFGSENNARKLMQRLQNQGIDVNMFRDPQNGMYYVFLMKFDSYNKAGQAKDTGLNGQYSGKLWVKVVE